MIWTKKDLYEPFLVVVSSGCTKFSRIVEKICDILELTEDERKMSTGKEGKRNKVRSDCENAKDDLVINGLIDSNNKITELGMKCLADRTFMDHTLSNLKRRERKNK